MSTTPKFVKVKDASRRRVKNLEARCHTYYARLTFNGKTRRYTLKAKWGDVEAAKDELANLRKDGPPTDAVKTGFKDFVLETFLPNRFAKKSPATASTEDLRCRGVLIPKFGNEPMAKITPGAISRFLTELSDRTVLRRQADGRLVPKGLSKTTVHAYQELLRAIFKHAVTVHHLRRDNPCDGLDFNAEKAAPKRLMTREEVHRIAEWMRANCRMGELLADAFLFLAYTGARMTSGLNAEWAMVNFAANTVCLTRTKNGDPVHMKMTDGLRTVLLRVHARQGATPSRLLFPTYRTPASTEDKPMKQFRDSVHRACRALGLEKVGFHHLRHFFASEAVMAGVPNMTVALLLGHKDGGKLVGEVYGHLSPRHMTDALEMLNKREAATAPATGPALVPLPKAA